MFSRKFNIYLFVITLFIVFFITNTAFAQVTLVETNEPPSQIEELFEQQKILADKFWQAGDFLATEKALTRALELKPDWAAGYRQLAITKKALGNLSQTKQFLLKALEIDPTDSVSHFSQAIILKEEGKLDEALNAFRAAAKFDTQDAFARAEIGKLLEQKGEMDKAIRLFRKALELNPTCGVVENLSAALRSKAEIERNYYSRVKRLAPYFTEEDAVGSVSVNVISKDTGDEASLVVYQTRVKANSNDVFA
ncbi:MAG: tetratricopeptide repeat protein, partial [Blastocatellia bacterium]|nr:tetratricopeptide repeat protein [Blastocatellia bacterium]